MLGLPYTINEIAQIVSAKDLFQGFSEQIPLKYIAYDTRNIQYGEETLFVALKSSHRDGHDFIAQAIEKGVRNFLVDRDLNISGINYAIVENCLDSLQVWAKTHREKFTYPVIGITGSNGKTTVKEWLTTILEAQFQVVKSPMSYNSQLGVPLSLLQLHPQAQIAIIEAGISQKEEMAVLAEMIQPTLGILTHIGSAHADGFSSLEEKIEEKLKLFSEVETLVYSGEQETVNQCVAILLNRLYAISENRHTFYTFANFKAQYGKQNSLHFQNKSFLHTAADRENVALCVLAALKIGMDLPSILERLELLYPIQMRTEMITDNPEITIINDSYNSDFDSIQNAFEILQHNHSHKNKKIILSDILHQGNQSEQWHKEVLKIAKKKFGQTNVYTIGKTFYNISKEQEKHFSEERHFVHTEDFISAFQYADFRDCTVLLKGARQFELERLIPFLNHNLNATVFKINLNALSHNLRYFRSLTPKKCKVMCMVKAFSYGSGTWEIAEALEKEGVDYLAVAYTSEAIELREKGIRTPIMVINPDIQSLEAMLRFDIQPEIYDFALLERYVRAARMAGLSKYPIHLKFDTGMGRLGFLEKDIDNLIPILQQYPDIQVISLMTHLAAADEPEADNFTLEQLHTFEKIYQRLHQELGISPFRHALNSAGILRFPQFAFDMVRLGIGLYGTNPAPDKQPQLLEIGTLQTSISQIHHYPAGTSIGYGRSQFTTKDSRIATIPIGYADGIFRVLGNGKTNFWVHDRPAPIVGRVCMDMIMIDVSDIPDAAIGDEVLIFGTLGNTFHSVSNIAKAAGTIAYEILTRISPRVRRVYVRE